MSVVWVSLETNGDDVEIFGRIDEDGLMRVTCIAEHPEFAEWIAYQAWLAEGNTPEPWSPAE